MYKSWVWGPFFGSSLSRRRPAPVRPARFRRCCPGPAASGAGRASAAGRGGGAGSGASAGAGSSEVSLARRWKGLHGRGPFFWGDGAARGRWFLPGRAGRGEERVARGRRAGAGGRVRSKRARPRRRRGSCFAGERGIPCFTSSRDGLCAEVGRRGLRRSTERV